MIKKAFFATGLCCISIFLTTSCAKGSPNNVEESNPEENLIELGEDFNFSVISDMNRSYGSTSYTKDLDTAINSILAKNGTSEEVSLVLSTGDMVAGQKQGLDYKAMWRAFHSKVTERLNSAGIAFAPSPGNHDASIGASFKPERVEYSSTFKERSPSPLLNIGSEKFNLKIKILEGSEFPFYYAFTFKGGLFISLDATNVGPISVTQYKFLESTLAKNVNSKFKVIFGHMPLYPFGFFRAHEYMAKGNTTFYKDFETLLEKYKVDYFLSGHHHVYYPGHRNGKVNYVSVPLLGSGARTVLYPGNTLLAKTAFLNFSYKASSGLSMKAIDAQTLKEIPLSAIPEMVSVPAENTSSCTGCATLPTKFFIDPTLRALYFRVDK